MTLKETSMAEGFEWDRNRERRIVRQWLEMEQFAPMRKDGSDCEIGYYAASASTYSRYPYDGDVRYYSGGSKRTVDAKLQAVSDRLTALGVRHERIVGNHDYPYIGVDVRSLERLLPKEPAS
jgi:hypothetical protein